MPEILQGYRTKIAAVLTIAVAAYRVADEQFFGGALRDIPEDVINMLLGAGLIYLHKATTRSKADG